MLIFFMIVIVSEFRYEHTCECNPCSNFDDKCTDAPEGEVRVCEGLKDMSGQPFSFIFMQNRPDDTDDRELVRTTHRALDLRSSKPFMNSLSFHF